VKDVLERAKTWSPEDVRDAMNATNLMTPFGPVKFETRGDYDRQNFLETIVLQVIDGKFEVVWPEKQATKKYVFPLPR
jgi:branched-chain amino acid transport system substrate-binding protein